MMPQYKVRVERHQRWEFEVEAASEAVASEGRCAGDCGGEQA